MCYPAGTPKKKYNYSTGKPYPAFKKSWKKMFPERSINTGCDSFVNLVVKECGYKGVPIGKSWSTQIKWYKKHFRCIVPKKQNGKILRNQFKAGDIVYWAKSDGSHHIYIIVKDGKYRRRAEAVQHGLAGHKGDKWSHIGKGLNCDVHKVDYIFRAK